MLRNKNLYFLIQFLGKTLASLMQKLENMRLHQLNWPKGQDKMFH